MHMQTEDLWEMREFSSQDIKQVGNYEPLTIQMTLLELPKVSRGRNFSSTSSDHRRNYVKDSGIELPPERPSLNAPLRHGINKRVAT